MSDNRGQFAGRLGGASLQNVQPRPEWWLRSWCVSLALGFVLGFLLCVPFCIALSRGIENYAWLVLAGLVAFFTACLIAESQLEKHLAGFKVSVFWRTVGAVLTLLVVAPLTITPSCGWHWDNGKCPAPHQVHHAK